MLQLHQLTVSNCSDISNHFAAKLSSILNSCDGVDQNHRKSEVQSLITSENISDTISDTCISLEAVSEALVNLKKFKSDGKSNHFVYAAPVLSSDLFTAILRHGVMPKSLGDCTLVS